MMADLSRKWLPSREFWICTVIACATLATYANVRHFDFVEWDDHYYPLNTHLHDGFTVEAVKWAFTSGEQANWHPLTWLSHLADYQLYGPQPGPDHVTGLIVHVLACLMLFFFVRRATGAVWRSALVTFIFALHPLHVESVAWVSERKDVLCAFFWFLTAWCWVRYAERPTVWRYLVALVPFCLGVLSKPMIVSLPFVLLLLDFWPLRRPLSPRLLLEKVPFLALSAASSVVTYLVQSSAGAVKTVTKFPIGLRIGNALTTWMIYIGKTLWPANLPFFYPYPKSIPVWQATLAGAAILTISLIALGYARKLPWLTVGWFWYFVSLIPVIGFVQVGNQARADRYMYIPMVGLAIIAAWGAADLVERWPRAKPWIVGSICAVCIAMIPATWIQIQYWKDNETLFAHAISVSSNNDIAYHNLGMTLSLQSGHDLEALANFDAELSADPSSAEGHTDRGATLMKLGRIDEAIDEYKTAMRLDPGYEEAYVNYGGALSVQGRLPEAIAEYEKALGIDPDNTRALYNRGVALLTLNRVDEAIQSFNRALEVDPNNPETLNDLGAALTKRGRWTAAIVDFDAAVHAKSDYSDAYRNLGEAMMKTGRMQDAATNLRSAVRINPKDAAAHNMLGFVLVNSQPVGQNNPQSRQTLAEAIAEIREAVRLDPGLASAQENLGRLLAQNPENRPEAVTHIENAVRITQSPALQAYLVRLRASQGSGQ